MGESLSDRLERNDAGGIPKGHGFTNKVAIIKATNPQGLPGQTLRVFVKGIHDIICQIMSQAGFMPDYIRDYM